MVEGLKFKTGAVDSFINKADGEWPQRQELTALREEQERNLVVFRRWTFVIDTLSSIRNRSAVGVLCFGAVQRLSSRNVKPLLVISAAVAINTLVAGKILEKLLSSHQWNKSLSDKEATVAFAKCGVNRETHTETGKLNETYRLLLEKEMVLTVVYAIITAPEKDQLKLSKEAFLHSVNKDQAGRFYDPKMVKDEEFLRRLFSTGKEGPIKVMLKYHSDLNSCGKE